MKHGSSGVVTIPMSYRKYHNINHGDEMIVLYDSLILMAPKSMEHMILEKQGLIDELLGMSRKPTENEEKITAVPIATPAAAPLALHAHPDSVTTNVKMKTETKVATEDGT